MDKFKAFVNTSLVGRILLAILFVIEAISCFLMPNSLITSMPAWIPFQYFWVYFYGFCWFAAGVSFLLNTWTRIMGILIASLIFLAILFDFSQGLNGPDTFVPTLLSIGFFLAFAGGSLIVASEGNTFNYGNWSGLHNFGRILIGTFYFIAGYLHFTNVSMDASLINWMPGAEFWVVFTGICWMLVALSFWTNIMSRPAAVLSSLLILVIIFSITIKGFYEGKDFTTFISLFENIGLIGANLLVIMNGKCGFKK